MSSRSSVATREWEIVAHSEGPGSYRHRCSDPDLAPASSSWRCRRALQISRQSGGTGGREFKSPRSDQFRPQEKISGYSEVTPLGRQVEMKDL